ncbi:VOC family protein [Sphingopyxis indica]|uniref:VOC family protein n=1 Tax=Sphingopyxis indica TaxID=436663 RepID=UPI0029392C76|nr:VOC family protein [Sphingopyxis indica]WOF44747.1 VOC family protein [Sphingopyxis indica]
MLRRLDHYSIRTTDLHSSQAFYTNVLGLVAGKRPPFAFPGVWLYFAEDSPEFGVVHLIGAGEGEDWDLTEYLGQRSGQSGEGNGSLDHIAFVADNIEGFCGRLDSMGIDYNSRSVPELGLVQVFLIDPDGITIELNFPDSRVELLSETDVPRKRAKQ